MKRVHVFWFSAVIQWYTSSEDGKSASNDIVIREIGYKSNNRPTGYMDPYESKDSDIENVLVNEERDTHFFYNNDDCVYHN